VPEPSIYQQSRCVSRAVSRLIRRHGCAAAALDALRPTMTARCNASIKAAHSSQWALFSEASASCRVARA
jgi:hypothetical protein